MPPDLRIGRAALRATSTSLRLGMVAQGSEALVQLVDWLAAGAGERVRALEPLLGEILQAQQRGDHLCVADLLEYELGPRLDEVHGEGGATP